MILAVRDKFQHWAQGPVAVVAVAGSLYLPDVLSQACPQYHLTLAAPSAMMPQPGLSHDSSLSYRSHRRSLSCVEHISIYTGQPHQSSCICVTLFTGHKVCCCSCSHKLFILEASLQLVTAEWDDSQRCDMQRIDRAIQDGCPQCQITQQAKENQCKENLILLQTAHMAKKKCSCKPLSAESVFFS